MAKPWTGVGKLDVRLESGLQSGYLYGNSLHQAGVVVSLMPTNGADKVSITKEQLDASITLIDYVTGEPLSEATDWSYVAVPRQFHGVGGPANTGAFGPTANGLYQTTRYISCDRAASLRTRSIAVRVKPTAGAAINSAQNSAWDSKVVLAAFEAVDYRLDVNTAIFEQGIPRTDERDQRNYYLRVANSDNGLDHYIYRTSLSANANPFFAWTSPVSQTKVAVVWPLGPQETSGTSPPVAYNQRPREVCATLLRGKFSRKEVLGPPAAMTIFDQYGNRGQFHVRPSGTVDKWEYGDTLDFFDGTA
jgi:hypothetical protein